MQMLGTWSVAFQAIRQDGGRCFKGVHLSPLGFAACQSKKCTNKAIKCPTKLSSAPISFL